MVERSLWLDRIAAAHRRAPIVWLTGVRRVGKTTLVHDLPGALYLDCDLPSVAERLGDPVVYPLVRWLLEHGAAVLRSRDFNHLFPSITDAVLKVAHACVDADLELVVGGSLGPARVPLPHARAADV